MFIYHSCRIDVWSLAGPLASSARGWSARGYSLTGIHFYAFFWGLGGVWVEKGVSRREEEGF